MVTTAPDPGIESSVMLQDRRTVNVFRQTFVLHCSFVAE
jgi:hypothetical protein